MEVQGDERRTREVQTIDSARRCVGGAALSPGIVAARLLCRCFVTDRKVACLVCTNPTTSATIVRHVRDYSEKRSFDDKPASKVASNPRSGRSSPSDTKVRESSFFSYWRPSRNKWKRERERERSWASSPRESGVLPVFLFRLVSPRFEEQSFRWCILSYRQRRFPLFASFRLSSFSLFVEIRELGKRRPGLAGSRCKLTIKPCKLRQRRRRRGGRRRRRRRRRRDALTGKKSSSGCRNS